MLKLPHSEEEWRAADNVFNSSLIPSVLAATGVEEKNRILSEGIYSFFAEKYGTYDLQKWSCSSKHKRRKQHKRGLSSVTEELRKARSEFRNSVRTEFRNSSIAANFFRLIRLQSSLRKKAKHASGQRSAMKMRQECYKNFWKFAQSLLDDESASRTEPAFTSTQAHAYFTSTYQSSPHEYLKPDWMPAPPTPMYPLNEEPINRSEIQSTIQHTRLNSSPSPFDQVSYRILKRCPSLTTALFDIFQSCWSPGVVPSCWKAACIRLI